MTTRRLTPKQLLTVARKIDALEKRMVPLRQELRELHRQLEAHARADSDERCEEVEAIRRRLNFVPTPDAAEGTDGAPLPTQTTAFGQRVSVAHDIYSTQPMRRWYRQRSAG